MRAYNEDDYLDEYETDDDHEDEGCSGEEYEQAEVVHQPTQEQLGYLKLRERLKEQMRKNSGTNLNSSNKQSTSSKNNFGSFFGPSQPVIAQRVIQESKSMLENPDLAARVFKSSSVKSKSSSSSAAVGSKPQVNRAVTKSTIGIQKKSQILKNTRDYSFLLSDDAELPAPKERTVQNLRPPKSDAQSKAMLPRTREPQSDNGKKISGVREEKKVKPVGSHGQARVHTGQERAHSQKLAPVGRQNQTSSTNKPLYKGSGPSLQKAMPSKISSVPAGRSAVPHIRKPTHIQAQPSSTKRPVVQKMKDKEPSRASTINEQPVSSYKSQYLQQKMKPPRQGSKSSDIQNARMKKKPRWNEPTDDIEDPDDIRAMIRGIMGYDPNRKEIKERDRMDDRQMEVGFDVVMQEEKRSARAARQEDEEEWRKIQEEEERERQRRARKRKLMNQH